MKIKIKKKNGDYIAKIKNYKVFIQKDMTIEEAYNSLNEMYQKMKKILN
ncbi:hypothetical protein QKV40_gp12 [Varidnaviria sp.]|uniref:Uncharacterized protein n=1 Tax=Lokiarchaeia virus SkuldV1 TaxID=3058189 RepID=A0AA46MKB5_9VIRU|nr:hypothetical protein QKV40_gp12 [Varidnaviria sp.]UPO70966.1 hypothetical protein 11324_00012 [Lokiarchaeia virus SkuldV1]